MLTADDNFKTFSDIFKIQTFIAIFGFSMKNALQLIQTSLKSISLVLYETDPVILRSFFQIETFYTSTIDIEYNKRLDCQRAHCGIQFTVQSNKSV